MDISNTVVVEKTGVPMEQEYESALIVIPVFSTTSVTLIFLNTKFIYFSQGANNKRNCSENIRNDTDEKAIRFGRKGESKI